MARPEWAVLWSVCDMTVFGKGLGWEPRRKSQLKLLRKCHPCSSLSCKAMTLSRTAAVSLEWNSAQLVTVCGIDLWGLLEVYSNSLSKSQLSFSEYWTNPIRLPKTTWLCCKTYFINLIVLCAIYFTYLTHNTYYCKLFSFQLKQDISIYNAAMLLYYLYNILIFIKLWHYFNKMF